MKDAGHRACIEAALAHERTDRTPVNNFALATAAHSAGVTVEYARWHPEVSAQTAIDYSMKTHSDFVKPVLDSQIPFVDLGLEVRFPENDYGSVKSHIVETGEDVDGLALFDPEVASECPKFQAITNALRETSKRLEEDLHICGLSWGPITTAGYLMGTEDMLMATFMDPDIVKKLVKKVTPFVSDMQNSMLDAGATVMWMADPTSSEDILSPEMFVEYSLDEIGGVISSVKREHKDVPTFVHICGNTLDIMDHMPGIGTDCFSFDHAVDIAKAKAVAGDKMTLMGNIDPIKHIFQGTPEGVREECYRMIDIAGQDGGYIIAPGCETPITSPDENVIAMGMAGRDYWKKTA
jgi:uroporphyrinogen decarboxylase